MKYRSFTVEPDVDGGISGQVKRQAITWRRAEKSARVRSMDRAAARWTPLTEVFVKEVGSGVEGKHKYSRDADIVSVNGMRCGWYEREKGGLVAAARRTTPLTEVSVRSWRRCRRKIQSTHRMRIWYPWMGCVVDGTKEEGWAGWTPSYYIW